MTVAKIPLSSAGKNPRELEIPRVSVVLPVKNGQQFVGEAISSVLCQTFKDFELLVIDDGSSDETLSICASFEDSRIRIISNDKTPGIVGALNLGIGLARGEYIARIDSDDLAEPQRFQIQVDVLEKCNETGLVGSWVRCFGHSRKLIKFPVESPDLRLQLLFRNPLSHPSVMYRSNWSQGRKGYYDPEFEFAEDYEMWTRISSRWDIVNIPRVLTLYRTHSGQATRNQQAERQLCVDRIIERQMAELGHSNLPERASVRETKKWWWTLSHILSEKEEFAGAHFRLLRREIMRERRNRRRMAVLCSFLRFWLPPSWVPTSCRTLSQLAVTQHDLQ